MASTRDRCPAGVEATLEALLSGAEHMTGDGLDTLRKACELQAEGLVSKQVKAKCLNRQEFIVIGWTEPEGRRPHLGSLLLGCHAADGALTYAGRVGNGMMERELAELSERLQPLAIKRMPLAVTPPGETRFGSPLKLRRVHWVKPKLVVEVTYLTWTDDGLLRQLVFQGLREDMPAR